MPKISVSLNGPYQVEDNATVVDWNDHEFRPVNRARFALCRCGASTTKPFCDGTHSRVGFQAAEAAVPASDDTPA